MLTCRACLRRCLEPLNPQASSANTLRPNAHPLVRQSQQRLLSTRNLDRSVESRPPNPTQVKKLARNGEEPWKNSMQEQSQKRREREALRRRPETGVEAPNLAKLGRRDPAMSVSEWERRKKELRHLQDPLELAKFVRQELAKDKPTQEVLQLVRMASQSMECVVSWNHIIDHYLAKSRVSDALKVYNEVRQIVSRPAIASANKTPDEEAGTVSRFIHLHNSSSRIVNKCPHSARPHQSIVRIPLALRTKLTSGAVHHPYKCCIASLRESTRYGCFVGYCGQNS